MRTTRPTVRPDRRNGATTIVFRLARPAIVRFTVVRVHPTCERVGSFRVRAHAGVNRVRWRGRVKGRPLAAGTYRLLVRAKGARRDIATLRVVVVRGKPLGVGELREARAANACGQSGTAGFGTVETVFGSSPGRAEGNGNAVSGAGNQTVADPETPLAAAAGTIGRGAKTLGARFQKVVEDTVPVHPLVWAALAFAIVMLAAAAVPSTALVNARAEALAYRRFEIALAGTAALAAAFLMYLIS